MGIGIATRGHIAPLVGSGGGGGGGPDGIRVIFALRDDDGVLAPAIDLSGGGVTRVSKNGGAFAARAGDAPSHIEDGFYYYELDTTETDTIGPVLVKIELAGYQTVGVTKDIGDITTTDDLDDALTTIGNAITAARNSIEGNVATRASQTSVDALPTVVDIDDQLSLTHGADSWAGATVEEIDTALSLAHGDGSWEGATASAIDAVLSAAHGDGSWEGLTDEATSDAILDAVVEGSHTVGDAIRGILGALVGRTSGYDTGTIVIRSLDGAKIRWTITTDETGRLTVTPGDLT